MRVFVTGGTGFVGRYVVRRLLEEGYEVFLGVRDISKAERLFGSSVKALKVDFMDINSVRSSLAETQPEAIIHLIGILQEIPRRGITFGNVHHLFSVNIFEGAKEMGVGRVLFMSALGTHDDAPSKYHKTKRLAELHLINSGLSYSIMRPSLILGAEQKLFPDMDKITKFFPVVALPGGGSYRFQPVDVRDVADCFLKALGLSENGVYELCGSTPVSFRELLKDIFSFWNRRVFMIPLPVKLMYYMGKVIENLIQPPPFSSDQMLMMWRDNVCGLLGDVEPWGIQKLLSREPIPYKESLRWALEGYAKLTS